MHPKKNKAKNANKNANKNIDKSNFKSGSPKNQKSKNSTLKKDQKKQVPFSKKANQNTKKDLKKSNKDKKKVIFIKSGFVPKDFPVHQMKEVAFVGRSNAGKSSLINAIANQDIAHVSQTPGKTRLLNFFDFKGSYVLVDMPGYGFAARSGKEIEDWQKVIETYLASRECLAGLVLVMDVRRDWDDHEQMLYAFAHRVQLPLLVALTKIDKLNQKELRQRLKALNEQADTSLLFPVSNTKKQGFKEMEDYIFNEWIKDNGNEFQAAGENVDDEDVNDESLNDHSLNEENFENETDFDAEFEDDLEEV